MKKLKLREVNCPMSHSSLLSTLILSHFLDAQSNHLYKMIILSTPFLLFLFHATLNWSKL